MKETASKLLAQATGKNTANTTQGTSGFDINQYNAAQPWDISKVMGFGYAGYKTFLIVIALAGLIGIAGCIIALATSGENSGRQRGAIIGIVIILVSVGLAFFAPWLMSVVSKAAETA